ncbi:MAG: DUF2490 domain-containing protein [Flavobacteriales bacterium]
MKKILTLFAIIFLLPNVGKSQFDQDQLGAWYMYFFNTTFKESSFGVQGDIQYRNWNMVGDLEQLLIRGGVTYKPKNANIKFTLGYGNITKGAFGESTTTTSESRIYQEALIPTKLSNRFNLTHRFRYEQRFNDGQDLRTRYRYNLFVNIPITKSKLEAKAVYLALYNEIFINGQRNIGNGVRVEIFDINRFYSAIGYIFSPKMKVQLGLMRQSTNNWSKNQLQVSFHQKF